MIMTEIDDLFHMDAGQVLPDGEKMCYLQTESAFFFACDLNSVHRRRGQSRLTAWTVFF